MTSDTYDAPLIEALADIGDSPEALGTVLGVLSADCAQETRPALWMRLAMSGLLLSEKFPAATWPDPDIGVSLRITHRLVAEALEDRAPACLKDLAEFWTRSVSIVAMVKLEMRHEFEFNIN